MPANSASGPIRSCKRASRPPTRYHRRRPHGEMPSQGYTLFEIPIPRRARACASDAEELGRVYRPHLAHPCDAAAFAAALEACSRRTTIPWRERTRHRAPTTSPGQKSRSTSPGAVNLGEIMLWLRDHFRPMRSSPTAPAISPVGCIAFTASAIQHAARADIGLDGLRRAGRCRRQAALSGAQGICFAGDGDFLMNGQEFMTAVQYDLPIVIVVLDNSMYGTIRMHQEREYPGRISCVRRQRLDCRVRCRHVGHHPRLQAVLPKVPGAVVAVILSIILSSVLDASSHGVAVIGSVQGGFPPIGLPEGITGAISRRSSGSPSPASC